MSLFILVLRFTASLQLRVKPSCIFTYIGIFFSSVCRVTVFFEHVIIVEPGGMLRLRFIFFFKISIGYNMNAGKIMKSFAGSVAKSKKKVLKTIGAFLIAVKAELSQKLWKKVTLPTNLLSKKQWSFCS